MVITTIMFNFIASAMMVYLLNYVLKPKGVQEPSTANVVAAGKIPQLRQFVPDLRRRAAQHDDRLCHPRR